MYEVHFYKDSLPNFLVSIKFPNNFKKKMQNKENIDNINFFPFVIAHII